MIKAGKRERERAQVHSEKNFVSTQLLRDRSFFMYKVTED